MERTLYLLTGCTATGKTGLALRWAERFGAEIVSCDAMLFYRGMDIGTAKPTAEDRARVPHHLIDLVSVDQAFDVGRYVSLATRVVEDIAERGRLPLVVGGSGFYLMSFLRPVIDAVQVDDETRERVEALMQSAGPEGVRDALRRCHPGGLGDLDTANPRRLARALERCWSTGRTLADLKTRFESQPPPLPHFGKRICVIEREDDDLKKRIEARAKAMVAGGLVEEVRRLKALNLERNPTAARAIGYRETLSWLDGGESGSVAGLAEEIAANTWKLVKKQKTWFRHQLPTARRLLLRSDDGVELDSLLV
jgi:tRNA dimethylallyltransferase